MTTKIVAVVGKGRNCPEPVRQLAFDLGAILGATCNGRYQLLTGGMGGVMHAACAGFKSVDGGITIGILPVIGGEGHHDEGAISGALDVALRTPLHHQLRNVLTAYACDVMLVLPGSHGTYQEAVCAIDLDRPTFIIGDHRGYMTNTLTGIEATPIRQARNVPRQLHATLQ